MQVAEYGLSGQRVVGVPAHRATVQAAGSARDRCVAVPSPGRSPRAGCVYFTPIYRSDISAHTVVPIQVGPIQGTPESCSSSPSSDC
jgi:hypothetical protein